MTFNLLAGPTGATGPQGAPEDIGGLPAATTPLDGTEELDVVQGVTHSKVTTANILPFWSVSLDDGTLILDGGSDQVAYLGITGQFVVANGTTSFEAETFHATEYMYFEGDRARGTAASPAAVQDGDVLAAFIGVGYGDTGFTRTSTTQLAPGLWVVAAGTATDTSAPTKVCIMTTPSGSVIAAERLEITEDGGICVPFAYAAPTTGQTVTMAAGARRVAINPAGTLAALTISLPPTPANGQLAGFASTKIITALTVSAQSSKSVAGALSALAVGGSQNFVFRSADDTWYPAP